MEHLTTGQLERYESILKKIEDEHQKRSELKKQIHDVNNRIIATSLTLKKDLAKEKIFKILVKVFESIFDIYDVRSSWGTSQSEIEKLSQLVGNKFYYVQVFISKQFQERIVRNKWLIIVTIKNSKNCVSRSLNLSRQTIHPLCLIVPFDNCIEESTVDVSLSWPGSGIWPHLTVASVPIDISYHLHLYSNDEISFRFKVLNLFGLYNNSKSISTKLPIVKSKMPCRTDFQNFLQAVIKNSYYKWDPRKDSCFSTTEYTANTKGTIGLGTMIDVELDTSSNSLTLHGSAEEVLRLKNYFLVEFSQDMYEIKKEVTKNVKTLIESLESGNKRIDDLVHIHQELNDIRI